MSAQHFRSTWEKECPNPLPKGGPWCEICRTHGHDPYHCPMMKKYQTMPKSTFCNFCKSVGHEDKDCRTLEMMKERTSDAYRIVVGGKSLLQTSTKGFIMHA
jgi:hypothetical protein